MSIEISLIQEIEKMPVLYNHHLPEYNRKEILEEAWLCVAKNTNMSVSDAKEKWRNIRSSLLRSLKQRNKSKKPYYLYVYLEFLIPFLKASYASNIDYSQFTEHEDLSQSDVCDESLLLNGIEVKQEVISIDVNVHSQEMEDSQNYDNQEFMETTAEDLLKQEDVNKSVVDRSQKTENSQLMVHTAGKVISGFSDRRLNRRLKRTLIDTKRKHATELARAKLKRQKLEKPTSSRNCSIESMDNDPRNATKYFLMSLVPELESLNEEQMRMFKIKVMMLIDDIKSNFEHIKTESNSDNQNLQKRLINLLLQNLEKDK